MELVQILLVLVVLVLTGLLLAVGAQVFLILKEAKETITRFNKTLEERGFIESIRLVRESLRDLSKRDETNGENGGEEETKAHITALQEKGRRFWRGGKPLL